MNLSCPKSFTGTKFRSKPKNHSKIDMPLYSVLIYIYIFIYMAACTQSNFLILIKMTIIRFWVGLSKSCKINGLEQQTKLIFKRPNDRFNANDYLHNQRNGTHLQKHKMFQLAHFSPSNNRNRLVVFTNFALIKWLLLCSLALQVGIRSVAGCLVFV